MFKFLQKFLTESQISILTEMWIFAKTYKSVDYSR